MPKTSATHDKPLPQFSTRKGNAGFALAGVDGRSLVARRFREIYLNIESDLGGDLSEAQRHLIARAATLALWCEERETELAAGGEFDAGAYATISNALRRLLSDLGLERRMKDATPTLAQFLADRAAQ
ncbi:hypothetical protein SOQ14_12035 [Erythrobacter sp. T5W1-R]|uniref:hypothetical protein n=1 Tax=Erythrobacter sp. T5W1-R TaxID=3101752 RepID=UPI002AFEE8EB|nr:hypothetical protein [Erythrobacter sp. T5W1-R]MEA1619647.1 hypothetical protein [Erythrobacter sp. T5W1-R]